MACVYTPDVGYIYESQGTRYTVHWFQNSITLLLYYMVAIAIATTGDRNVLKNNLHESTDAYRPPYIFRAETDLHLM